MPRDRLTPAHARYDAINAAPDPVAFIRLYIDSDPPTFEDEYLDFKGGCNPHTKMPLADNEIKKIWCEALAGFANIGGGVLVWGIDARKINDIDAAHAENLVSRPHAFKSRLKEFLFGANDPVVSGVEIESYTADEANDLGFVVCLIPESSIGPHSAEWLTNKPHIERIGDSFRVMSNRLVRKLLHPQFSPELILRAECRFIDDYDGSHIITVEIELILENLGTGTAREVFLVFRAEPQDMDKITGYLNETDWRLRMSSAPGVGYQSINPIFPKLRCNVLIARWRTHQCLIEKDKATGLDAVVGPNFKPFDFAVDVYADNVAPKFLRATIIPQDIKGKKAITLS